MKLAWLVLVAALAMIAFGAVVVNMTEGDARFGRFGRVAVLLAKTPWTLEQLSEQDTRMYARPPDRFDGPAGWRFGAGGQPGDVPGYVLLSRHDGDLRHHRVELYDLSDFSLVHSWEPDADALLAGARRVCGLVDCTTWDRRYYRAIHPLLLENGDLIFKDHYGPLFRLSPCGERLWMKDDVPYHHSTEPDGEGGFWIPTIASPSKIPGVKPWFYEDFLTHVSPDGEVLFSRSLTQLLVENGYNHWMFSEQLYKADPLHLNDIEPVLEDGPYWKRGDLFLSVRRFGAIMLYRPSTDELLWVKEGPWMGQHDVDVVNDHTIAIFNNNTINRGSGMAVDGVSEVLFYDFATDSVSSPYRAWMEAESVSSPTEGLFTILPTGHLMVEEENAGRLLLFAPSGELAASYVNKGQDGNGRLMGWSRYIPQDLGDAAVASLRASGCAGTGN